MIEYCEIVQDEVETYLEHIKIPNCKGTKPIFYCDHDNDCSINYNYCPKFLKLLNLDSDGSL